MEHELLPDYEKPPVVETVLAVQFDPLPEFKNAHLGAFWKSLDSDQWPEVQDVPPIPPQFERFEEGTHWADGAHKLELTQNPVSRIQIKNKDGDGMIQLQNSRLIFNWIGHPGRPYPRYEKVREGLDWALRHFLEFVKQERLGEFRSNQWEVIYVNNIPKKSVWITPSDWGFFKPLAGLLTFENLLEGESFSGEWHFIIPDKKGRLHVNWHHGFSSTPGGTENETVRLTFTARGSVETSAEQLQAITEGHGIGRRTIVKSFKELMTDKANEYWGLKHVND